MTLPQPGEDEKAPLYTLREERDGVRGPDGVQLPFDHSALMAKATATDGDLSVTVEITHGLLTVAFARLLTDHPEGAGAGLTVVTSPRGRDVKELRTLYPLPVCPAEPQCSPDCPHHRYPDGAAARQHAAHATTRARRRGSRLEDDHG